MERRLITFYTSRLFTFLVFFLVVLIFNAFKESSKSELIPVFASLLLYGIFNLIYYSVEFLRKKILLILIFDAIFISLVVYFTGGLNSNFHILYLVLIVFAGFYLESNELYFLATISVVGFMATVYLYYIIDVKHFGMSRFYSVSYPVAVYFVAIYTIALIIIRINKRAKILRVELKRKEREIEEITRLKNKIVDTIASGIITTDSEYRVNYVNPQGISYIKKILPDKKIIGMNFKDIFPVADFLEKLDYLERYVVEVKGRMFGISIVKLMSGGKFSGILAVFQDITELKEMERRAQFKDKMTELGELSASFAHEFRNSLASVKGAVQLLKEGESFDKELVQVIEREIERLSGGINDFLRFARKDYQNPEFKDIKPVVEKVVNGFRKRVGNDVDFEYEDNLKNVRVFFEEVRLEKVLQNILMNAKKAVENSREKKISAKLYKKGEYAVFEVRDSGIGIKDEDKSKIFEPYYSGFAKGIGIGLALSKAFVEDMRGKIEFESEEGTGSVFRVYLLVEGENE